MFAEKLQDLFVPSYISDGDTETHHVCGCCGDLKPLSAFYKDGKTRDGKIKYRRDCIECYKKIRIAEARFKSKR